MSVISLTFLIKISVARFEKVILLRMKFFATLLAISHSFETPHFWSHPAVGEVPYKKIKKVHISRCLEKYGPISTAGKNIQELECTSCPHVFCSECRVKGCLDGYIIDGDYWSRRRIFCYTTEENNPENHVKGFISF